MSHPPRPRPLLSPSPAALLALLLVALSPASADDGEVANGQSHAGADVTVDLPGEDHVQNAEGIDRAGLCVFASLQMAANWENISALSDLFTWMKTQPGGGWPERVKRILDKRAPGLPYVQYEGADPAILDKAIRGGRPVGVTYGYGDWYRGKGVRLDRNGKPKIDHMVLLVHLDPEPKAGEPESAAWAAIIDNNDSKHYTWMTRAEFLRRWVYPTNVGWCVVLLAAPPPPIPANED